MTPEKAWEKRIKEEYPNGTDLNIITKDIVNKLMSLLKEVYIEGFKTGSEEKENE